MPNLSSFKAFPIPHWGSLLEMGNPNAVPLGAASEVRNCRYTRTSVTQRHGIQVALQNLNQDSQVSMVFFNFISGTTKTPKFLLFDRKGRLEIEDSTAPGKTKTVSSVEVTLPAGSDMQAAIAYNRAHLAFSDLQNGQARPALYDGNFDTLDPLSGLPMGQPWKANYAYFIGDVVTPTVANGHYYICSVSGTSGANQPAFPTGAGNQIADNTITWTEQTPSAADSAVAGNVCAGQHFWSLVYITRSGYYYGLDNAAVMQWTAAGGFKATFSNLWVGGPHIVKRAIILTVAGAVPAGPYFYMTDDDVITGSPNINITKTIILDNVSTSVTLNFTDDYLLGSLSATNFFRKAQIPPCVDVYFAESLGAMIYTGVQGLESSHVVSPGTDPETYYANTNQVDVALQDGYRCWAWRELRGVHFSLKDNAVYRVEPNAGDPSKWPVVNTWHGLGISGPRAVDTGSFYMIGAGRSGLWINFGDYPIKISLPDIEQTWKNINWNFGHRIWVKIDEENLEVRVGIPTGENTDCDKVVVYSFISGFDAPLVRSERMRIRAVVGSRMVSIDDIAATQCIRVDRVLPPPANPASPVPNELLKSQLMYASANPDGTINMMYPGSHNDNGQPIDQRYCTGAAAAGGYILQLGGLHVGAVGQGKLFPFMIPRSNKVVPLRPIELSPVEGEVTGQDTERYAPGGKMSESWRALMTNGKLKDCWFEVFRANIRANPVYTGRTR